MSCYFSTWFAFFAGILFCTRASSAPSSLFYNGINFLSDQWSTPRYDSIPAQASLDNAANSGVNSIAVVVTWFQPAVDVWGPIYPGPATVTDSEISAAVVIARMQGMSIMLRPAVDPDWRLPNTSGTWRGQIGRNFTHDQWHQWFDSYSSMIIHYACVAAMYGVEIFSVGMELSATQSQDAHWRSLISKIRSVYTGQLVYGANWDVVDNVTFFDALDFIGVDAYYPLVPSVRNATMKQLVEAWQQPVAALHALAVRHQSSVILTELGYCSSPASHADPAHVCGGPPDENAQLKAYAAAR
jgi:hypothetical protein